MKNLSCSVNICFDDSLSIVWRKIDRKVTLFKPSSFKIEKKLSIIEMKIWSTSTVEAVSCDHFGQIKSVSTQPIININRLFFLSFSKLDL
jgi:hypothetical protein